MAVGNDLTFYSKPSILDRIYGSNPVSWKLFFRIRPGKMVTQSMHGMHGSMKTSDEKMPTNGELYYVISNGIRLTGMPVWRFEDKPEAIWDLVSLIRRLPKLSTEELKRLQEAARQAGGELSEEAGEPEKKEAGEAPKEQAKPKHTHTHKH